MWVLAKLESSSISVGSRKRPIRGGVVAGEGTDRRDGVVRLNEGSFDTVVVGECKRANNTSVRICWLGDPLDSTRGVRSGPIPNIRWVRIIIEFYRCRTSPSH